MKSLYTYLPQDRRMAISRGKTLPDQAHGTALFADISGFTLFAEKLAQTMGERRGAEELTRRLNAAYDELIGAVEMAGGSVISFAGDSITCWFSEDKNRGGLPGAALCALVAAWTMQLSMRDIPELALKVTVTSGPARRLVVGDPQIQLIDTLAGATLERITIGEQLARKAEILADEATLLAAAGYAKVSEFRQQEGGEKFGVVIGLAQVDLPSQLPEPDYEFDVRPWLLQAVYERELSGAGAFLTELRSVVALFIRFDGIDYDGDDAASGKLDTFVRCAQVEISKNGGFLLGLSIGDKGSYCYASFGAPMAHENEERRALNAALALRQAVEQFSFIQNFCIGVSRGAMLAGAYGGATRRAYSVLGDEMNLAARLMQSGQAGEIIVSGRVQYSVEQDFVFEALPPRILKGKTEPVQAFLLTGPHQHQNYRLMAPSYALPMVGRKAELALITNKLEQVLHGHGQLLSVTAEAGMGKSRLVAEVIHHAQEAGFTGFGGACQSDGTHIAYLGWQPIWQGVFGVDGDMPPASIESHLASVLQSLAPQRLSALPLLGAVIGIPLAENEFTHGLEAKDRKSALEVTLVDCLRTLGKSAQQNNRALLFVLEDAHWIDPLSLDLLEQLTLAMDELPVCILIACRPPEEQHFISPRVENLPNFINISLGELSLQETTEAIFAKVAQLFPDHVSALPENLTCQLAAHSQGNPFYLEELLNYLHDHGIDPRLPNALENIELPDSLHALVLSRIDRLTELEKNTLKVASIIGRVFRTRWIQGYYPELGSSDELIHSMEKLRSLEITPLNTPEPELTYLFKHIVTHEVTYTSLPFATRSRLHEKLALWIESSLPQPQPLDLLAFHYGRSSNLAKKREYLEKAGDASLLTYANDSALGYYNELLPLLSSPREQITAHLKMGNLQELMGYGPEAERHYQAALALAEEHHEKVAQVRCQLALGMFGQQHGEYSQALDWYFKTQTLCQELGDQAGLGKALEGIGMVHYRKGEAAKSMGFIEQGLALARAAGDQTSVATMLNNLGNGAFQQGDYAPALRYYEESLAQMRLLGNMRGVSAGLTNLAMLYLEQQGDLDRAQAMTEESLALDRAMGDRWAVAVSLSQLANIAQARLDFDGTHALHEQSMAVFEEIGDKRGVSIVLANMGSLAYDMHDYYASQEYFDKCRKIFIEMDDKRGLSYVLTGMGMVALDLDQPAEALRWMRESLTIRHAIGDMNGMTSTLTALAGAANRCGAHQRAITLFGAAKALLAFIGADVEPNLKAMYDEVEHAGQDALGADGFKQALEFGLTLPLEDVVIFALSDE